MQNVLSRSADAEILKFIQIERSGMKARPEKSRKSFAQEIAEHYQSRNIFESKAWTLLNLINELSVE
jgi:hypothetical protein